MGLRIKARRRICRRPDRRPCSAASLVDLNWTLAKMTNEVIDSGTVVAAEVFERCAMRWPAIRAIRSPVCGTTRVWPQFHPVGAGFCHRHRFHRHRRYRRPQYLRRACGRRRTYRGALRLTCCAAPPNSRCPFSFCGRCGARHNFVLQRRILINQRPFAMIRVGVSTALIADEVHQLVWAILGVSIVIILFAGSTGAAIGDFLSRSVVAIASGVEQLAARRRRGKSNGSAAMMSWAIWPTNSTASRARCSVNAVDGRTNAADLFKALRSMTDAIILIDADTTILFANAEAQTRLGLGPNAGEGRPLQTLLGGAIRWSGWSRPPWPRAPRLTTWPLSSRTRPSAAVDYLVSILPLSRGREAAGLLVTLRDLKPWPSSETVVEYSSHLARWAA